MAADAGAPAGRSARPWFVGSLTRAHILRHIDVLAYPKSKVADQRAGLGPPEVSAQRAIMALAQHLCAQPAAGGDAEAITGSLTLIAAVQELAPHQQRPAFRCASRIGDGPIEPVDELTERRCSTAQDGPEDRVDR